MFSKFRASFWPERLASLLAFAGIFVAMLPGFHVSQFDIPGSDIKTLYASAWCFGHGLDPYDVRHIAEVFAFNHVVAPPSWYGHAPVYPPFTLALLVPLTVLPMVPAVFLWAALSALALGGALALLAQAAGEVFAVGRGWRLAMILVAALSPLVGFALLVSNVSMMVFALSTLAVTARGEADRWPRAAGLAIGLLLKPHLALWVVLALLLMREPRGQRLAWRAIVIAAVVAALVLGGLALAPGQAGQLHTYQAVVHQEMTGGSMDVTARDVMRPAPQITSLASLLGCWTSDHTVLTVGVDLLLAAAGLLLLACTRRLRRTLAQERYLLLAAWGAFGLIATYHRAQDGIMLFLLLPWLAHRLARRWWDGLAWTVLLLGTCMSYELAPETFAWMGALPALHAVTQLMIYRQANFFAVVLALVLLAVVVREAWGQRELRAGYAALRDDKG